MGLDQNAGLSDSYSSALPSPTYLGLSPSEGGGFTNRCGVWGQSTDFNPILAGLNEL